METKQHVPKCIGIIMDGNRRWARKNNLPTLEGHRRGYLKMKDVVGWAKNAGIKNMIIYALSTENWNRSKEEVSYLLDLFRTVIMKGLDALKKDNTRIIFVGDLSRFPKDLQAMMKNAEEGNKNNFTHTLVIAASYGGRAEILHAVNQILLNKTKNGTHSITEEEFEKYLWTSVIPNPDLIIRTGGEKRLSNFLPWQSTYSELFFSDTFWPDFSKEEFTSILKDFSTRQRRIGR